MPGTDLRPLTDLVRRIAHEGHDADVCVEETSGQERWILNVRSTGSAASPERHRDWHDLSLYLLGGNDVRVGGELTGAYEIADGELREGTLTGGSVFRVRAGDLLWVPANVPHANAFELGTAFVIVKLYRSASPDLPVFRRLAHTGATQHLPSFLVTPTDENTFA